MAEKRYNIVYEDDYLIVADKPPGMLVIPTPKGETNTLTDLLNRDLDERRIEPNAYPCHRLDRETSGLIIYAKGKRIQKLVMEEFRTRRVKKVYIAVARGDVAKKSDTIRSNLFNRNKSRNESAITEYRVLERRGDFTVLEVRPVTGRTNQIRIHLARIGHPILGESVYAFRKDFRTKFRRTALHASCLEFTHPVTGNILRLKSELPEDMRNLINERLKR